ncbi:MAG: CAP domain-containing protein [Actinomycetota bacterium]
MTARGFVIRLLLGAGLLAPSVVTPVTTIAGAPAALSVDIASVENQFFQLINAERAKVGLAKLTSDGGIVSMSRSHSQAQSSAHRIYHSTIMRNLLSRCTLVGENVGRGPTVDAIHRALMNSPSHRREILGAFDRAGVGVAVDDTYIYVTQMFCRSDGTTPPPAAAPAPKAVAAKTAPRTAPRPALPAVPKVVAAAAPVPAPIVVPPPPPPPAGMGTPYRFL